MSSIRQVLRVAIAAARDDAIAAGSIAIAKPADLPRVTIERPARPEHGD